MGQDSVSLSPLKNFQADRIRTLEDRLAPREIQLALEGTDLRFDPATRKIEGPDGAEYSRLSDLAAEATVLMASDRDGNLRLDRFDTSDADFLRETSRGMRERWEPLAANLAKLDSWLRFKPTLEAAKHYRLALFADNRWYAQTHVEELAQEASGRGKNPIDQFGDFIFESVRHGLSWALAGDIEGAHQAWSPRPSNPLNPHVIDDPISGEWVPIRSLHRLIHSPEASRCQNAIGLMHYLKSGRTHSGAFGDFIQKTLVRDEYSPDNRSPYFARSMLTYLSQDCAQMKPWLMEEWKMSEAEYDRKETWTPGNHFANLSLSPYPSLISSDPQPF